MQKQEKGCTVFLLGIPNNAAQGYLIQSWMRDNRRDSTFAVIASLETTSLKLTVLERRKPLLLFLLSGVLLLRLAQRRLAGLLFHEPPRKTRLEPLCRLSFFSPSQAVL